MTIVGDRIGLGGGGNVGDGWGHKGGPPGGNGDRGPFGANNSKDTRSTPPEIFLKN